MAGAYYGGGEYQESYRNEQEGKEDGGKGKILAAGAAGLAVGAIGGAIAGHEMSKLGAAFFPIRHKPFVLIGCNLQRKTPRKKRTRNPQNIHPRKDIHPRKNIPVTLPVATSKSLRRRERTTTKRARRCMNKGWPLSRRGTVSLHVSSYYFLLWLIGVTI
jgi:hypothetical protein